ncbi:hypothetical protein TNCV_3609501 [Trichonephila clavipes]|nr:hypothetical protein TNCV_3609501 [Trichonephila clavipes]
MICSQQKPSTVVLRMEVLHGFYDSEQFFLVHTIISFWFGQTLAEIGDDMLLSIYLLRQHSPYTLMTCIRIQNKLFPNFEDMPGLEQMLVRP